VPICQSLSAIASKPILSSAACVRWSPDRPIVPALQKFQGCSRQLPGPEVLMVGRTVATVVALVFAFYAFYGDAMGQGRVLNPFGILCLGFAALIWFKWDLVRDSVRSAKNESDLPIIRLGAKIIQGMADAQKSSASRPKPAPPADGNI
jgi:hypothetical protein